MKKILIVVDMQYDFITGPLGNKECEASVPQVVKVINEGNYDQIIMTRDTHQPNYLETREGKNLPVVHCIENTPGWEIVDEVKAAVEASGCLDVKVINKPSFGSTLLGDLLLDSYNKDDIHIDFCGVCTGICVISNAMIAKAKCPEAEISVIEKACACVTPDSHNTAIEAMKLCQIEMIQGRGLI